MPFFSKGGAPGGVRGGSKNRSKDPRFFCENCGAEVIRNSKSCPKCGRYFASVRCPSCDFAGAEDFFKDGCPVCGYSSKGGSLTLDGSSGETGLENRKLSGALPVWAYILTAAVFLAVIAALFRFIQ